MAEASPPQITVQSPGDGFHATGSPAHSSATDGTAVLNGRGKAGSFVEGKPISNRKSFPDKLIRNLSSNHVNSIGHGASMDEKADSQIAIDPLSQHILERTHPDNVILQKTRTGTTGTIGSDPVTPEDGAISGSTRTFADPTIARTDTASSLTKDKKKAVSFLSRFIGSKKKDIPIEYQDDESEYGDKRAEGTDADVFSQPIGFVPKFPAPPKYIKVRSRGKKEKDFNRVFLAQELRGRTGLEIAQAGGRSGKSGPVNPATKLQKGNAIWAMEFSKDGNFLAAGGHDHIVRVWAVISREEDRNMHEEAASNEGTRTRLSAPVFKTKPVQEYEGHTASVLDLSWSKNNFLLSSSMDKTVRLWHTSRTECLCCFKHSDFVTSIQFHPRDDRFFLAGSLDSKLRLWSIPDKSVAFWSQLQDLITSVAFTPDGKVAIAGCLTGICMFYETEGLKYQTSMQVRSAHGKNAKGSKVTGIQAINYPPGDPNGEIKLLITTNDSRVRVYNYRDKGLELKLKGNENTSSQIHATFSDDAKYVICGSEDRKVYIWSTGPPEKDKDKRPVEVFEAHSAIITSAIMAPIKSRQLLQASGDPLYELCNPPPVTLISRSESHHSSKPPTENSYDPVNGIPPTPTAADISPPKPTKPEESPTYIARSAHLDGNIIVTADYMGRIKVFRQDCAYRKRLRAENWDGTSTFSKKILNRSPSTTTRASRTSKRDSFNSAPSDRILSWRQSIERNGSHDSVANRPSFTTSSAANSPRIHRSVSPRKSSASQRLQSPAIGSSTTPPNPSASPMLSQSPNPNPSSSTPHIGSPLTTQPSSSDPLMLDGQQSYMFWNKAALADQAQAVQRRHTRDLDAASTQGSSDSATAESDARHLRPGGGGRRGGSPMSRVSALSSDSEAVSNDAETEAEEEVRCVRCKGDNFRARVVRGERRLECVGCGMLS